jgi:hypothetical protein
MRAQLGGTDRPALAGRVDETTGVVEKLLKRDRRYRRVRAGVKVCRHMAAVLILAVAR